MDSSSIRLVCFDLGGVLVQVARDWPDACRRAGVNPEVLEPSHVKQQQDLIVRYETGLILEADYARQAATCTQGLDDAGLLRVFDAWLDGPYAGSMELIRELKSRDVRTACLSNTNTRHWKVMSDPNGRYPAISILDHHFLSFRIGAMKPSAGIYQHVEEKTGFRPSQIIFFDDRPENVAAATGRGWHARRIDPLADSVEQMRIALRDLNVLQT